MSAKRILVVDDEEDVQELVCRVLRGAGYEVDQASEGGEAIEKMTTARHDLLILDLKMPGIDGWDVLGRLRQMKDAPLVLVLTAGSGYETLRRGTREGAAAFISKPFRFHELLATCHKLLSGGWKEPAPDGAPTRHAPRRLLMVEVTVLSKEGAPFFLGELVNLSLRGAQVELDVPLEPGDGVRVALDIPGAATSLSLEGRVQWRSEAAPGFAHGLAFEAMPPEDERRLRELLGQFQE